MMSLDPNSDSGCTPLVRQVESQAAAFKLRRWIGNDESARHHHSAIPFEPETVLVHLSWKQNSQAMPSFIGCYELNLPKLLEHGFIRRDAQPEKVRLRFIHDHDDVIHIQVLGSKQSLAIGRFSHEGASFDSTGQGSGKVIGPISLALDEA